MYVADRYEGIQARTFAECSDEEVARYIEANVAAVSEVVSRAAPDVALANHLVMGPAILARALGGRVAYAVKVHGSALEYTVKPHPERFLPFAREVLAQAGGVVRAGLAPHRGEPMEGALGDPDVERRTRLVLRGWTSSGFRPARLSGPRPGWVGWWQSLGRAAAGRGLDVSEAPAGTAGTRCARRAAAGDALACSMPDERP